MPVACSLDLAEARLVESIFSNGLINNKDPHHIDSVLDVELEMQILLKLFQT
jgi:hypothetical protein